jgi:hypothetical protein
MYRQQYLVAPEIDTSQPNLPPKTVVFRGIKPNKLPWPIVLSGTKLNELNYEKDLIHRRPDHQRDYFHLCPEQAAGRPGPEHPERSAKP